MGNRLTNSISDDKKWASVANFKNQDISWDTLDPYLFKDFTDEDMRNIAKVFSAKKSSPSNSNYNTNWLINHEIIRIVDIEWDPKEKGYSNTSSVKPIDENDKTIDYPCKIKKYSSKNMARLAVNIEALNDYKAMKRKESNGEIFYKIAKELEPFHKPLNNIKYTIDS